jgi:folate-binding protein YgfZ
MNNSPNSFSWTPLKAVALWKLSGPDRIRYLNGQVTQDIVSLKPGQTRWAAICNARGRMEGLLQVTATPDALYIQGPGELRESLAARLEKYLIADDAQLEDVTDSWNVSHWVGSTAPTPSPTEPGTFVAKNDRFGLPGYDVWTPGREPGVSTEGATVLTEEVLNGWEIEHFIPRWGLEMTLQTLPPEAGLEERAISYRKGCYVGQEIISRLKSVGHVSKCLVQAHTEGLANLSANMPFKIEERELGNITRFTFSERTGVMIVLGYLPYTHALVGSALTVAGQVATITRSARTH